MSFKYLFIRIKTIAQNVYKNHKTKKSLDDHIRMFHNHSITDMVCVIKYLNQSDIYSLFLKFSVYSLVPNTREGPNKQGGWADFFIYYMKNSGMLDFFPFITW